MIVTRLSIVGTHSIIREPLNLDKDHFIFKFRDEILYPSKKLVSYGCRKATKTTLDKSLSVLDCPPVHECVAHLLYSKVPRANECDLGHRQVAGISLRMSKISFPE